MGLTIVFASGKGGTGKSTVAAGVASCLAAMGNKTLCIDCDAGLRNLDIVLGMSDLASVSYLDVIQGGFQLSDAVEHPTIKNLFLLTAPYKLAESLRVEIGFRDMLDKARELYDYVVIDSPAGIGKGFEMAVRYADRGVIVTTADPTSIRDGDRTERCLRILGLKDNCLVVNRVQPKQLQAMGSTIDDAMDSIGLPLLGLVPEDSQVPLAAAHGSALILVRKKGAAQAVANIARRIQGIRTPLMKIK